MNSSLLRSAAIAAVIALSAPSAFATVSEDAQVLMGQGQFAEALKTLDQHLAKNPQDAEARFMRGLVLVRLNRSGDAIKVFADLTRDYPQLPEPYNNLAVLYAQQGDYEKARDALEAALATHPSYATAHENLGDIYAALAAASYNRALMLDQNNSAVRSKLALVGQVDRSGGGAADPLTVTAKAPRTAVSAAPAKPQPPRAPAPAAPAAPVAAAPVAAAPAVEPAAAVAAQPAAPVDEAAVLAAVNAWAAAWSQQSLDAYFAAYADDYTPEGGLTRKAWEGQRRDRISRPKSIKVNVAKPQVSAIDGERVKVTFTQEYSSDSFSDQVSKTLELKPSGGTWKITREYTR